MLTNQIQIKGLSVNSGKMGDTGRLALSLASYGQQG